MLWTLLLILIILWVVGFATDLVGSLIHILLVVAAAVFLVDLIRGRRRV